MIENNAHRLCIGIDLGTSNTEITVYQNGVKDTLPITQNRNLSGKIPVQMKQLPSLVCFGEDGKPMFGEVYRLPSTDIQDYIGRVVQNTKRMLLERPENKVYHITNRDGSVDRYSPQDIATLLLKRCYEEVTRQRGYCPGDPVMITVPCGYHTDQIHATIRAARAAGFQVDEDRELITEPVAALIEYIKDQNGKYEKDDPRHIDLDTPQNILVYDMGGGTLDLSVVRIEKKGDDEFHFRELANNNKERDRTIGGADFDYAVARKLCPMLLEDAARSRNCTVEEVIRDLDKTNYLNEDGLMETIHNLAYAMKPTLSKGNSVAVNQITFYDMEDWNSGGKAAVVTLNGGMVDGMESICYLDIVRDFLTPGTSRNILDPIRAVLDSAILDGCKVPVSEFDKILITGGMCKFAPVRQALTNHLETLAKDPTDPIRLTILESDAGLEAVSIGAAYSHSMTIRNHCEQLENRFYLDVTNGLPQELVARGACPPIRLVNPTEAIFAIYSGTGYADPDIRRQYYYNKRFSPPLSSSATVRFRLETKKSGEVALIGIIHQDGKPDEDIEFKEDQVVTNEANPVLAHMRRRGGNSVFQGTAQRAAMEGEEKRLFITSTSNHDREVSSRFAEMLYIMDLRGTQNGNLDYNNLPVYSRFAMLRDRIIEYYRSEPGSSRYPLFQYALYAIRQIPLDRVPAPNFPLRVEDSANLYDENLRQASEGLRDFCELIANLYTSEEIPEAQRVQLENELTYCITEWNWLDTLQLCISIAQAAASPKLAMDVQRRLMRRRRNKDGMRPEPMEEPTINIQSRIAQIYWNAINKGATLTNMELSSLELLLQGKCCTLDEGWMHSLWFAKQFKKLGEETCRRMRISNPALPDLSQQPAFTLSDVQNPKDLLNSAFWEAHNPKNETIRPAYWNMVNSFLGNADTAQEMLTVLSRRGRSYEGETRKILVNLPMPSEAANRGAYIRALGCCRTAEARSKLNPLWTRSALYSRIRMAYLMNHQDKTDEQNSYLAAVNEWLSDSEAVRKMVADHSFDLLAALCLCDSRNREKNMRLMSCIIATVPYGWISSQGDNGKYWIAVRDALFRLWANMTKAEKNSSRLHLTSALYHLTYRAWAQYPAESDPMNLALYNFSTIFLADQSVRDMYHMALVQPMLKLFAAARMNKDACPLKNYSQRKFGEFLDHWIKFAHLGTEWRKYKTLMILWYELTDAQGQIRLRESTAYCKLVGNRPDNESINLEAILSAPMWGGDE